MVRAILFDLDGTLIDTNELIIESFMYTFNILGKSSPSRDEIINCFGEYLSYTMSKFFGDENEINEAIRIYREFNLKYHNEKVSAYKNAHELVKILKNRDYKLGVVTSKSRISAVRGLEHFDLKKYFDVIVAGDDVKNHKPHEEPILSACAYLKVSPSECIMVGDSVYDIQSGKRAGTKTCGVLYSFMKDKLLKAEADYYIGDLIEVLDFIRKQFKK